MYDGRTALEEGTVVGHEIMGIIEQTREAVNRANSDSVRFPQGSVDRSGFGDTHLRSAHRLGNICRIRVTVAPESARAARLIHSGLEYPPARNAVRLSLYAPFAPSLQAWEGQYVKRRPT